LQDLLAQDKMSAICHVLQSGQARDTVCIWLKSLFLVRKSI